MTFVGVTGYKLRDEKHGIGSGNRERSDPAGESNLDSRQYESHELILRLSRCDKYILSLSRDDTKPRYLIIEGYMGLS